MNTQTAEEQWELLYNKASAGRDRLRQVNKELLEACKAALVDIESPELSCWDESYWDKEESLAKQLRAAIARAEKEGA